MSIASEKDQRTLWMGDLDNSMDANFIGEAFHKMGEEVLSVKIIYDKYSGQNARYCFVEMPSVEAAHRCMLAVNGKVVPDSRPPILFKLSFAQNPANPALEYSLFASNLASEVDDVSLYNLFGRRYFSCKGAKVFRNPDGSSRGLGIIRFGDQLEQQRALIDLNKWTVAGRPITLRIARHKNYKKPSASTYYDPNSHYKTYRDFYSSNQWQMYDFFPAQNFEHDHGDIGTTGTTTNAAVQQSFSSNHSDSIEFDSQPEDPRINPNIDDENTKFMYESQLLDRQLEASNWFFINSASFHKNRLTS